MFQSVLLLVALLVIHRLHSLRRPQDLGAVQIRRGPNVVGPWGLFQSFADLLKFVLKEPVIPAGANKVRVPAGAAGGRAAGAQPPGR
jgi:NADH-quinone oxidoreductase subunit H